MTGAFTAAPQIGDPMLAAKFGLPPETRTYVHRPRLVDRLSSAVARPLTLVTGPPGAGKTLLVASWARRGKAPGPVVWLTLDPADNAPGVFWGYVIEAFRRQLLPLGDEVGAPASAGSVDRSMLVRLICALDRFADPVVVVLDGTHVLRGRGVADSLGFVLDHAPDRLHLVLTSRVDPLLPLHRYRAEDRLSEIRGGDLLFTAHEAAQLLRRHGLTAARETVEAITGRTEGWAAGLRLCALAMERSRDPAGFARSFAASEQAVADYLLAEVLDAQSPATQDLLLRASILDRVHPELADALTGRDDGESVLAGLIRSNAFVEPLADTPWCRLHPLFAGALHTHLRSRHPGLEPRLHLRAARWLADAGQIMEALGHAATAGDWQWASAQAVGRLMIGRLLAGPDADRLTGLFSRMPADMPGAEPALVAAACRLARGDAKGCRACLMTAGRHLRDAKKAGSAPGPEALLTHALLRLLCEPPTPRSDERARRVARQIGGLMEQVPWFRLKEHPEVEALRQHGLACALLRSGCVTEARAAFADAVDACHDDTTRLVRHASLGRLALTEAVHGALTAAAEHATRSTEVADRNGVPPAQRSCSAHLALAAVAAERGDPHTARHCLDLTDACADVHHDPVLAAERAVLRSQVQLVRGQWESAAAVLDDHGPARTVWAAGRLGIIRSALALAKGDAAEAITVLEDPAVPACPARTAALARACLAAGDTDGALTLAASVGDLPDAGPADRVRAHLVQAHVALLRHDTATAQDRIQEAREAAEQEGLRQPFTEAGPWLRQVTGDPGPWDRSPHMIDGPVIVESLSERERQVLSLVARMMSAAEIAGELHLSVNTVKTHLRSIYRKLGVSRRREAVERAMELRLM
jgi:LuxR family maltose regulon positive regulatory protein